MKKFIKTILSWQFAVCFLIAWMITNGWAYVLLVIGTRFNIVWMMSVSGGYLAFLWLPCTPEKLVTIPIAIGLMKLIFPKRKDEIDALQKKFKEEKQKLKDKRKNKKKNG